MINWIKQRYADGSLDSKMSYMGVLLMGLGVICEIFAFVFGVQVPIEQAGMTWWIGYGAVPGTVFVANSVLSTIAGLLFWPGFVLWLVSVIIRTSRDMTKKEKAHANAVA